MSELKTQKNDGDVLAFLQSVEDPQRRSDGLSMLKIMEEVTGEQPVMWGPSIVGYGSYTYKYPNGKEMEWMTTAFSPRKQALTVYIMAGFAGYGELMARLGRYKTGKSCLYIKKLEEVDLEVLKELIRESVKFIQERFPNNG
ncbi:MAG: DUF1801 domain-containing protein [Bacteroidia bacterium]|nr:DUF1801 domain-containing protein [Bacteroidia bacterium]